jgi:hypothetical protein
MSARTQTHTTIFVKFQQQHDPIDGKLMVLCFGNFGLVF